MLQIILLIIGIVEAFRRPKIKNLKAEQFPGLPSDTFREWQALTLRNIDLFLWATWGVFFLSLVAAIGAGLAGVTSDAAMAMDILFLVLFVVSLIFAAIPGSKAKKLEKQMLRQTSKEYFEAAQLLLTRKGGLDARDKSGFTRLHRAAIENQKDVAQLLLANHALVDVRAKDGGTPLHYAAFKGHLEMAELLLDHHADLKAKDNDGETPLRLAEEEGHEEMEELLRRRGGQE